MESPGTRGFAEDRCAMAGTTLFTTCVDIIVKEPITIFKATTLAINIIEAIIIDALTITKHISNRSSSLRFSMTSGASQ